MLDHAPLSSSPRQYAVLALVACVAAGCGSKGEDKPSGSTAATGAAPATTAAQSAAGTTASPTAAAQSTFPRTAIKPLEGCTQDAYVMIETSAAKSTRTVAALLEPIHLFHFGDFKTEPGLLEVRVFRAQAEEREDSPNTIVAKCGTPDTCNEVAAYLAHARVFPKPQLHCGRPTMFGAYDEKSAGWGTPLKLDKDEVEALCARVAGCRYDADPSLPPKLFNDCAKSPVQGKATCGLQKTCAEVLSCVAK